MIKLIASDMDGTLLNDKMQISDGNAAAIRRAQQAGIEFMVATGRGLSEAQPLVQAHGLKTAFITLNGARVFDTDGQLTVDEPLPEAMVALTLETLQARGLYFELVTNQGIYSDSRVRRIQNVADVLVRLNPDTSYKIAVALAAARLELMEINYVDDYNALVAQKDVEVMKVIAFSQQGQKALAEPQQVLAKSGELIITSSAVNNIEINSRKAQKGLALNAYAAKKGLTLENCMAIGDNLNDESMITMAKYGVAMGNALPKIKALAQWTTAINTKDGVGMAIDKAIALNAAEKAE
ncbi:Cof-type HAD-IIB family hydrolase [Lacticaseibacillus baoqingensis]|uniref:Cof-type HAD-IIB family hydrolase n=1 Tax=Lacticaseibacillus baoqingensis TaxID=2486013 RepID=A0ABW4E6F5_9LACO|nr:Cof-type HAD-IIB family hydrolase [Lacticaseibacillus baoqingensis]